MNKRILIFMTLLMMTASVFAASTDTVNINLMVTPIITVDLNIETTFYNFGNVGTGVSTCSVTALVLSNDGSVGIKIDKAVWGEDEWYVTEDVTAVNGFNLWAMSSTTEPGQGDYTGDHAFDESNLQTFNALKDSDGSTDAYMDPSTSENLWLRLDMPQSTSNGNQQKLEIRLKAIAQ